MGRMLETLKFGDQRRSTATSSPAAPTPGADCVVEWEIGEEVPYVEVGGPNKKVELSPGLMKHPPQPAQPPHTVVEVVAAAKAKVVNLTPAQPMGVAFEAWPTDTPQPISTEVVAYHQPDHAASKEYAQLLDAMLANAKASNAKVLLALGQRACVGVSTVLANLAVLAAQGKNLRVLALDTNAKAGLVQRLGGNAAKGVADVVKGTLALEHAVQTCAVANLHLLAVGKAAHTPSESALGWLLTCLRDRYDVILVDGPMLADIDKTPFLALADQIYVVAPQGESANLGKVAAQSIASAGGRLCGLIHTHFQ